MVFAVRPIIGPLFTCVSLALIASSKPADPIPKIWPEQFHSILYMNNNGTLQKIDLWYDWPNGRNFNIIQKQLGELLYVLEWNNGTSFYYTLDSNKKCKVIQFPVGILTPNWLHGATYIGQRYIDNFLCNVWEKVDFITYFEDVVSKKPVSWALFTGMTAHVMTFEVGKVLEDPKWQAPVYCFNKTDEEDEEEEEDKKSHLLSVASPDHGNLMRPLPVAVNVSMLL